MNIKVIFTSFLVKEVPNIKMYILIKMYIFELCQIHEKFFINILV